MNCPPFASVVRVSTVCRLFAGPFRKMMVTGESVSFVEYVIA